MLKKKFASKLSLFLFLFTISLGIAFYTSTTLSATSINPSVKITDQKIDNNTVYVDQVVSAGLGWITIHNTTSEGGVGPGIGHTHLQHGISTAVPINIPVAHTTYLIAMLHIDAGKIGTYEFPNGSDLPVKDKDSNIVMVYFHDLSSYNPRIVVSDQQVIDNKISINLVEFNETHGWVAIYNQSTGTSEGARIGVANITTGINLNIAVNVTPGSTTDILYAELHFDKGTIGVFEDPGADGEGEDVGRRGWVQGLRCGQCGDGPGTQVIAATAVGTV